MERLIIGICGGTGSGKTTLAKNIFETVGQKDAVLISMDSYYKDNKKIPFKDRIKINYDHPDAIDMELLKD
ncbi:MAG: uridine kinase, partial [Clostridia bacterium]|nr:uridine kinase [Clostridia bacterium]